MEWIKNENILVTLFNNALYIYKIIFNGLDDDFLKNFNIDLILINIIQI